MKYVEYLQQFVGKKGLLHSYEGRHEIIFGVPFEANLVYIKLVSVEEDFAILHALDPKTGDLPEHGQEMSVALSALEVTHSR